MSILAIDPSLASSGYCVMTEEGKLVTWGRIRTTKNKSTPTEQDRLLKIYQEFQEVVKTYRCKTMVLEAPHVGRNIKTALILAQVRGVLLLLASSFGMKVITFRPTEIKQSVCKIGKATKEEVFQAIQKKFSQEYPELEKELSQGLYLQGEHKNDDITDAIAIAYTYRQMRAG